jgi:hypothetical protein
MALSEPEEYYNIPPLYSYMAGGSVFQVNKRLAPDVYYI